MMNLPARWPGFSDALDRIDRIVGVPCCCSSMLIREATRLEASPLDEHVWDATMAGPWAAPGRWGTHCTVTDLQRGGGGKTVASG